jgi:hypothetical protein
MHSNKNFLARKSAQARMFLKNTEATKEMDFGEKINCLIRPHAQCGQGLVN